MSQYGELEVVIEIILSQEVTVQKVSAVGGGSISRAYAISTTAGDYFLKANEAQSSRAMFEAEEDGLQTLKEASRFGIPRVYGIAEHSGITYLLMDLINSGVRCPEYWQQLGNDLAGLHKNQAPEFGYHRNNFIGSLPQSNKTWPSWAEFFIKERMTPMIRLARDTQLVDSGFVAKFDSAMIKIVQEMPAEPPALIHGDLWSGNLMVDDQGKATIIDPAVYYGHREMDLAFSQMFGGFSQEFYDAYNEAYPLEPGFDRRAGLYNLYPYLVHLNLFGRSYFGHIDYTIRRFT